jgi:hypothetical protein
MALGLALSEKQIPQITENTEKPKQGMELLESVGPRPRQTRYASFEADKLIRVDGVRNSHV